MYLWQQEKFVKCDLPNLLKSDDSIHIRFSTETQAVDIWTIDNKKFQGYITNYTSEADNDSKRLFHKAVEIDTALCRELFIIFTNDSIQKTPSQGGIKGWESGKDGITYFIEYSTPQGYYAKEYWTPELYKETIKEAKQIYDFVEKWSTGLDLKSKFYAYIQTLPRGCYHYGGSLKICNYTIKKQTKN